MESLSIEILNPKAKMLLKNLADLKLINIKSKPTLRQHLAKLRRNEQEVPSLDEITKEVEFVRQQQYVQNNFFTIARQRFKCRLFTYR